MGHGRIGLCGGVPSREAQRCVHVRIVVACIAIDACHFAGVVLHSFSRRATTTQRGKLCASLPSSRQWRHVIPVEVLAMEGGREVGHALLTLLERTTVAAAVSVVVLRCQQERALGRMKAQLRARTRRTRMQAAHDGPEYVGTSEAVIQLCYALGCGDILRATPRLWMKCRTRGTWEELRQCEKQHNDKEQRGDHQKQHNDEEQQREPAVQVGHEWHDGQGSNDTPGEQQREQHGDHQKQHSDEEQQREPAVQVGHDRCGRSSNVGDRMTPVDPTRGRPTTNGNCWRPLGD
ncbi:hypothetical protein CBR_g57142 [Chara braunii]|uniref:Uncharacterized protein n=1 Tax=Chara braunii TaxID=69332 RepID=A0A388ME81_CHABU|nr:hypothetical protein CBR_g57142 [Chara braunii]|eukprot:GBG92792.1 hypothetical protein CBR_g57142 [Chara braunii]